MDDWKPINDRENIKLLEIGSTSLKMISFPINILRRLRFWEELEINDDQSL